MNKQEYEQKRDECWKEYVNMLNRNYATRYVFDKIFDRAYALGRQEKDIKKKKMCLQDKSKVCDMCHECDIDISNLYHNNIILP